MATLLYVEDHPPARFLMQAIIEDMTNHTLLLAENGATAKQLSTAHHPHVYILDMDLPDTNGATLAADLQTIHPAPVILVSAYAESIKTGELGGYLYLAKPLDPDHVVETIRRALT